MAQTQCHQLQDLVTGDLANGGFVDQACVHMVTGDLGNGADLSGAHDDGVALHMAEAGGVAHHPGVEHLGGLVLGHRTGDHLSAGVIAVEDDVHFAFSVLLAVGQQLFGDDDLAVVAVEDGLGVTLGVVHAPDLRGFQGDPGALLQIQHRLGIQDPLACAVTVAVVDLGVDQLGVFVHMEGVDTVVLGVAAAAVMDAAAGLNGDAGPVADVKIPTQAPSR